MIAVTSVHLPKPVSTDLTINPVLTNLIGKDGGVKLVDVKHLHHKTFLLIQSLEGWPTKTKEAPSPREVRLTPLDTNPVF